MHHADLISQTHAILHHWSESLLRELRHPFPWDAGRIATMDSVALAEEIAREAGKCEAATEEAISACLYSGQDVVLSHETHYWLWRRFHCADWFLRLLRAPDGFGYPYLQPDPHLQPEKLAHLLVTHWWNHHGPKWMAQELACTQHDSDMGSPYVVD